MPYTFEVPDDQVQLAEVLQQIIDRWGQRGAPHVFQAVLKELRADTRAMESFMPHVRDETLYELVRGCRERGLSILAYGKPQWVEGEGPDYADYYFQEVLTIPQLDFTVSSWTEQALRRLLPERWKKRYSSTWIPADESTTIFRHESPVACGEYVQREDYEGFLQDLCQTCGRPGKEH